MMTGLLKFTDRDRYSSYLFGYIERHFNEVYSDKWEQIKLGNVQREIPTFEEISESVYQEVYQDVKLDLVEEAVNRKDYEIYGYEKPEFILLAYSGELKDESLRPDIEYKEFETILRDYMLINRYFFEDYHKIVRNAPILEVW